MLGLLEKLKDPKFKNDLEIQRLEKEFRKRNGIPNYDRFKMY
jgi:hypothetical protein